MGNQLANLFVSKMNLCTAPKMTLLVFKSHSGSPNNILFTVTVVSAPIAPNRHWACANHFGGNNSHPQVPKNHAKAQRTGEDGRVLYPRGSGKYVLLSNWVFNTKYGVTIIILPYHSPSA